EGGRRARGGGGGLQGGGFPEGTAGLRQAPERQQDPWIVRLWKLRLHPDTAAILHFFPDHRAEDDLAIRPPARERHLPIDLFGPQVVVGIEVLQPLSARQLEQAVARRRAA